MLLLILLAGEYFYGTLLENKLFELTITRMMGYEHVVFIRFFVSSNYSVHSEGIKNPIGIPFGKGINRSN